MNSNVSELKTKKRDEIYASFFLGNTEFALNVSSVQEVVNYPQSISSVPLSPSYIDGIFNLRGTIIPIVNLSALLKCPSEESNNERKVAILNFKGMNVGISFDSTGEIFRPKEEEITLFQYKENSSNDVVSGAIKLHSGERLVQLLDAKAVIDIKNLPISTDSQEDSDGKTVRSLTTKKQLANRKKCITFNVGKTRLAFEIMGIHEIVFVPEIQHSALNSEICLGLINLRGLTVPIISFSKIIGCGDSETDSSKKRIIVLKIGKELFGLLVDSVENISFYNVDEIMPVPLFSPERMDMFLGCISVPDLGEVFLLNQEKILQNNEILDITHGHAKIYETHDEVEKSKKGGERKAFISFMLNHRFGIPILDIREIIDLPDEILETPGVPSYVLGVFNLRGRLVSIIDMRTLYQFPSKKEEAQAEKSKQKVLVIQKNESLYGLVVDAIENILHIDQKDKIKLPELLSKKSGDIDKDVLEVIQIQGGAGMTILNLDAVLQRIEIQ